MKTIYFHSIFLLINSLFLYIKLANHIFQEWFNYILLRSQNIIWFKCKCHKHFLYIILILFSFNALSHHHSFRGEHFMTSFDHIILLCVRLMHLFQLQPWLYQGVFHGSLFRFHANSPNYHSRIIKINRKDYLLVYALRLKQNMDAYLCK